MVEINAGFSGSITAGGTGGASFVKSELAYVLEDYIRINDCIAGERVVKNKGLTYLPPPEVLPIGMPANNERVLRYRTYLQRAVFYNVAQWTLNGLVGEVFLRPPVVDVPPVLDAVVKDANGDGVSLQQQAKTALTAVLGKGRGGLLVDYPPTGGATTVKQQQSGEIRSSICFYEPEHIINWQTIKRGGKYLLSLVVLMETYDRESDDGFSSVKTVRYRVLKLENDVYVQYLYDQGATSTTEGERIDVRDGAGNPIPEIPFTFIGSVDNGCKINPAPMLAIVNLNFAHYRNSADYEESVFILGQPTAVATGLTKQWVDDVLHNELRVGARGGIPLPTGATFDIKQVMPNTLAKEAMDAKEKQMQSLGAKLVEVREVQQTATEAEINSSAQTSVLQSCADNVEAAFTWALQWCGIFEGVISYSDDAAVRGTKIKFEINSDFDVQRMTWQDRAQLLKEWQANAITIKEYRARLRSAGIAYLDDDDFFPEQEKEIMDGIEQQALLIKAEAQAGASQQPGGTPSSGSTS